MNLKNLYKEAMAAKRQGSVCGVTLVLPYGFKRPPWFPKGKLLGETERGRVYSFNPDHILSWLEKIRNPTARG